MVRLLELSILLSKNEHCSINAPIALLSELLDCRTLDECEKLFSLIDNNIETWKEDIFFKNVKNQLLRACNDLLRRLSRNQNTVFCGRILIFLANFFPLFERSGLNLTSEFNQDNSTSYSLQDDLPENISDNIKIENDNDDDSEKEKNEGKINEINVTFYRKFWQLQVFFRNPNIVYQKNNFKNFQNYCTEVFSIFSGSKIDPNSCLYFHALGLDNNNDDKNIFFVKYLTNQKLLELQLSDSNFRRHILIQMLIIFQYFTSHVKSRLQENTLNEEQLSWINQTKITVNELIEETPPNGKEVRKVIDHLLNREEFWNNWKNEGCVELKEIIEPEESSKKTSEFIRSTYVSHKKTRIIEQLKNDTQLNKILIGNAEMNRLWNFCPDNFEACKSMKRIFTPSIEQFFEPVLKLPLEERKYYCSESNFCWKSLRLLSQKSDYFFVPNNQAVKPVSDYLDAVIDRLIKEYNIVVPKSVTNNDDNKTETEDISDDELLKNVDSNSVKSNEEELEAMDADTLNTAETATSEDMINENMIDGP